MNRILSCLAMIGIVAGGPVLADDTTSQEAMTTHQAMKDCIERQKSLAVSMSKAEMKRICKDKLKQQKAGEMPEQPPTDVPHN